MKKVLFVLLMLLTSLSFQGQVKSRNQVLCSNSNFTVTLENDALYFTPAIGDSVLINVSVNKEDHGWFVYSSKDYLLPLNVCSGKTIYIYLAKYNTVGLNRINLNEEYRIFGYYSFNVPLL